MEVNGLGVTVWAGIGSTSLVGTFFEGTVNGKRYLDMLKTKVFPIVMSFPISVIFNFNKMEHLRTTPKMFDNE